MSREAGGDPKRAEAGDNKTIWQGWPEGDDGGWFASVYDAFFPPRAHRTWDLEVAIDRGRRTQPAKLYDLGAGNGRSALAFADAGLRVVAVEREPRFVEILAERLAGDWHSIAERIRVVRADIVQLPADFTLDSAFSNAFMNLTDPDRSRFLHSLTTRLHPGGEALLLVVDLDGDTLAAPRRQHPTMHASTDSTSFELSIQVDVDVHSRMRQERWRVRERSDAGTKKREVRFSWRFESVDGFRARAVEAGLRVVEVIASPTSTPGRRDHLVRVCRSA